MIHVVQFLISAVCVAIYGLVELFGFIFDVAEVVGAFFRLFRRIWFRLRPANRKRHAPEVRGSACQQ